MRLAQLRHQMLIAMGLPACWTTQTSAPPKPLEPAPVYATTPKRVEPEIAMFDRKSCSVDTIVETVCGRLNSEYCDATANRLEVSNNAEGLYVTTVQDAQVSGKDFILDDQKSEAFVARLQALNEKLEGKPACCYSRCTALVIGAAKPLPSPLPSYHMRNETCIPQPVKGTTQPDATNPACPQGVQVQGELRPYNSTRNDLCCYATMSKRVIIQKGRPARVDGTPMFASIGASSAWHAPLEVAVPIDPAIRERLAASWLEAAKSEHASIAAFSMTSLRLLALGAPPELIAATHRAALDEIEHARIAFALASAYATQPLSPIHFEAATDLRAMSLADFALETFIDGCIGETAAALEASRAAASATDPAIVAALEQIAIDEGRHAELAWAIVAWCVRRDPAIVVALRSALGEANPIIENDDDLAEYGVLGAHARRVAYEDVVRDVVTPCFAALAA